MDSVMPVNATESFYCQYTLFGLLCLSAAEFFSASLQDICPSGNCIRDCTDPGNIYDTVPPQEMVRGRMKQIDRAHQPLYSVCLAAANISRSLRDDSVPAIEATKLRPYFKIKNETELELVSSTATRCLMSTCDHSPNYDQCTLPCSPPTLLINNTTPSPEGVYRCLRALCYESLPPVNQDIAGIGVSLSYIIQCVLSILLWGGLVISSSVTSTKRKPAFLRGLQFNEQLVTTLVEFQKAQCYFSIPVQIAALLSNPFRPDRLTAYAFIQVAINGFLPQTLILLLVHRYGRRSWYLLGLTMLSWALASIVLWPVQTLISSRNTSTTPSDPYRSTLPSCGSSSALSVCAWATGASALSKYNTSREDFKATLVVWSWCTLCLLALLYHQLSNVDTSGDNVQEDPTARRRARSISSHFTYIWFRCIAIASSGASFYIVSLLIFMCFGYLFYIFYVYFSGGLVDLTSWGFGQVVAITVWIPPMVEFIHLLFNGMTEGSKYRLPKSLTVTRVPELSRRQARTQGHRGHVHLSDCEDDDTTPLRPLQIGKVSKGGVGEQENNQISPARTTSRLQSRSTLRVEEGNDAPSSIKNTLHHHEGR